MRPIVSYLPITNVKFLQNGGLADVERRRNICASYSKLLTYYKHVKFLQNGGLDDVERRRKYVLPIVSYLPITN